MREQQLDGRRAEEVASRYLEMRGVGKCCAEPVGVGIGGDDDGHAAAGFEFGIAFGEVDG